MAKDKKKGLGTGLEALFTEDLTLEENKERALKEITELPVQKVEPRQDQPRRRFDEEALEDLAESIAKHGVIQPITVRPQESGYYQIIAGERRWRAARKAGLETVPVHILTVDEQKAMEMALVENLQREDLNPIEEAQGYEVLQQTYGMTQEEVAQSVGKSRPAIANALRLLMLSEDVRKLVEDGELSAGHARTLLPLEHPDVQYQVAQTILSKKLSVRRAEALVDSLLKSPEPETPTRQGNSVDYLGECARELEDALGRRVRMQQGRKSGRIELEYYDADDREALIEALRKLPKRK